MNREPLPGWFWVLPIVYIFVPLVVGSLSGYAWKKNWPGARLIIGRDRAPRAWDHLLLDRPAGGIRCKLKSGTWIAGVSAETDAGRPFASEYPEPQDLYLPRTLGIDPDTGQMLTGDSVSARTSPRTDAEGLAGPGQHPSPRRWRSCRPGKPVGTGGVGTGGLNLSHPRDTLPIAKHLHRPTLREPIGPAGPEGTYLRFAERRPPVTTAASPAWPAALRTQRWWWRGPGPAGTPVLGDFRVLPPCFSRSYRPGTPEDRRARRPSRMAAHSWIGHRGSSGTAGGSPQRCPKWAAGRRPEVAGGRPRRCGSPPR